MGRTIPAVSFSSLDPIKDENPTQRFAWVTLVLIVVNVGVYFLVQQAQPETKEVEVGGEADQVQGDLAFNLEYAAIPCELTEGNR